ncbi:MAG TPA: hypothetical protein ENH97_03200 [bacterium]|nr:hypothetical protein [bacterium]
MALTSEEKERILEEERIRRFLKNPGLAGVYSFLWTGLGQIYNGEINKGLIQMTLSAVGMILVILGAIFIYFGSLEARVSIPGIIILVVGILGIALLGIHSIRDAKESAQRINDRR